MNERPEYEANVFAAELLLPDDNIIELTDSEYDIEQIARAMSSDVNLVALKFGILVQKGYSFKRAEYREDFLR